jgi:oligopeptide transport system permease protein
MKTCWQLPQVLAWLWLGFLVIASILVRVDAFEFLNGVNVEQVFAPPSEHHWLGTDAMGRDLLVRTLRGSGVSLMIVFNAVLFSLFMALLYGGVAGASGQRIDLALMIGLDIWMSLPASVLAALVGLLLANQTDSIFVVGFVIGATHWGRLARLVRGEVIRLREKNFIKAAESMGASNLQILKVHIIPHLSSVVGITIIYQIPNLILSESFLSFIGLGVQAPETSWGILLQDGWRSLQVYPHLVFYPAAFLFLTILAINTCFANEEP